LEERFLEVEEEIKEESGNEKLGEIKPSSKKIAKKSVDENLEIIYLGKVLSGASSNTSRTTWKTALYETLAK